MDKSTYRVSDKDSDDKIYISLPTDAKPIKIGPGTVPLSGTSITKVSMKDLRNSARKLSELGVFDTDRENETTK